MAMTKIDKRTDKLTYAVDNYNSVRDSAVSWRRKSSYRKPIKRRISKLVRRELKNSLRLSITE